MMRSSHHSLADWDKSSDKWTLSMAHYTSPPTSLNATGAPFPIFLCNHPSTLCLPQGRILCQVYNDVALFGNTRFLFRNQRPTDQVPDWGNTYVIHFSADNARLMEVVNGQLTWEHYFYGLEKYGDWCQYEVTWWNYPPYDNKHPLAIQLRRYYAGSWHDYGRAERDNGRWHDSPINRVGFHPLSHSDYIDDTEIHAPVWPPPGAKLIYTSMLSAVWPSDPSGSWVQWDLSSVIPPEAIAVEASLSATDANTAGCRPSGSTLNRLLDLGAPPSKLSCTIEVEVGTDRKIETKRSLDPAVDFRIVGYWTPG